MKKFTVAISTFVAGSMLFLGAAGAADDVDVKVKKKDSSAQVQDSKQVMSADKLIGKSIQNDQGQDIGTIKDILFSANGDLEYFVLSEGGVLGVGEDLIPIPFAAVENDLSFTGENLMIATLTEDKIKGAPKVKEDDLVNLEEGSGGVYDEVHAYFGQEDADRTKSKSMTQSKSKAWEKQDKKYKESARPESKEDRIERKTSEEMERDSSKDASQPRGYQEEKRMDDAETKRD